MHICSALPDDLAQIAALLQRRVPELMHPADPPLLLAAGHCHLAEARDALQAGQMEPRCTRAWP